MVSVPVTETVHSEINLAGYLTARSSNYLMFIPNMERLKDGGIPIMGAQEL